MAQERETFGPTELALALSHFDIGVIRTIRDFPRGSRRSPKIVIDAERGRYLFKRRARAKADLQKVAFAHHVQLHLAAESFPLPHLVGTRPDNNSMLVMDKHIYELFEYIQGVPYDGSLDATFDAGRILGLYHKLLVAFRCDYAPPKGSYHGSTGIRDAIGRTIRSVALDEESDAKALDATLAFLTETYQTCADAVNTIGLSDWPNQIVHGDWHPGNMLFIEDHVVAVIDYDSARMQQRVIDLANGALQFSITGGSEDPSKWPDYLDQTRLKRFLRAYDAINVVSKAELQAVPYLMCEAMIAEAVLPIAATGHFGRMDGFPFLQMIDRKVKWVLAHKDAIVALLTE